MISHQYSLILGEKHKSSAQQRKVKIKHVLESAELHILEMADGWLFVFNAVKQSVKPVDH